VLWALLGWLLAALGCSGLSWAALGCSGLLGAALGCSGLPWVALGCYGLLWGAVLQNAHGFSPGRLAPFPNSAMPFSTVFLALADVCHCCSLKLHILPTCKKHD